MTEELNQEIKEEKQCKCLCCSEGFRDFLKIAAGSFVGVFFALTLFAALHKPPMSPCHFRGMMKPPIHHGCYFKKHHHGDFSKMKLEHKEFERQIPVKVDIER